MPSAEKREEFARAREENEPRYRRLSVPFGSEEACAEALSGFYKELGEIREKYKIPDVLTIVAAKYLRPDCLEPMHMATSMQYGDMSLRPTLILSLYKQESFMIQRLMDGLVPSAVSK